MPSPVDTTNAAAGTTYTTRGEAALTAAAAAPAPVFASDLPSLSAVAPAAVAPRAVPCTAPPSVLRPGVRFVDGGSASPRFARMTYTTVPATRAVQAEVALPLAVVLTPLADVPDDSEAVLLVDHGAEGPLRCQRCRAYLTPSTRFGDGGNEFTCALCGRRTDVPGWYFAPTDATGTRTDVAARPELCRGSVEYALSNKAYFTDGRPPAKPVVCFVLDATAQALRTGALPLAVAAVRQALQQGAVRERVAFVTYDACVHYWDLSAPGRPRMLVYADTAAMAAPFVPGVFADYAADAGARAVVDAFLDSAVELAQQRAAELAQQAERQQQPRVAAALGAALQGACLLFKQSGLGGRVVLVSASAATAAPGALLSRQQQLAAQPAAQRAKAAAAAQEQELQLPKAQTDFYEKLARVYAQTRVGCDVFLLGGEQDVVTLGAMARLTGGEAFVHADFDAARDGWRVQAEVARSLGRVWGYDGALRVRCSRGLGVREYDGAFSALSSDVDADLPVVTSDTTLAALLEYDERLPDDALAHVQAALLYTTRDGERRVRVHNVVLPVARDMAPIYKGLDGDAVLATLARAGAKLIYEHSTLPTTTAFLGDVLVSALVTYRRSCCQKTAATQLVLPEALRLLPLYVLALLKQPLFRHSATPDARAAAMLAAMQQPLPALLLRLYPKCYSLGAVLSAATSAAATSAAGDDAAAPEPQALRLGEEFIGTDDVLLADDGAQLVVWVRGRPPAELLAACFGVADQAQLDAMDSAQLAQAFATQLAQQQPPSPFAALVSALAVARLHNTVSVCVVPPASSPDRVLMWDVEDRRSGVTSYKQYLCHIHRRIMTKISEDETAANAIVYAHRH